MKKNSNFPNVLNFKNLRIKNCFQISNFKFQITSAVLTIILLFVNSKSVLGQTTSLSLWPPLLEALIKPGKAASQVYRLTNNSSFQVQIFPQVFPFKPLGENGLIEIIYPKPNTNYKEPVLFSIEGSDQLTQPFFLSPQETKEVIFKIGVPRSTPENDYYYTLFFSTAAKDQTGQNQTASVAQIGTNIIISVSQTGQLDLSGEIEKFSVSKLIDSFSPVNFIIKVKNTGNTYFKPFGKISVWGMLKQKYEVNLLEQNVLANSTRQLTVDPFKPTLPFGPFRAQITFSLNENGQPLSQEIKFWYLPYKATAGLILLITVIHLVKKVRSQRKNRGASQTLQ